MKQTSLNRIRNIFYSCSGSGISLQSGGFCGSDRVSCWWRRKRILPVLLFTQHNRVFNWSQSLNRQIVKRCWRERGVYAWSEHCVHVQFWTFPVELYLFEIGDLIAASVQVLSPHTGEYFVFLISIVPFCFGVIGTRARWLFKKSCLWHNSSCHTARGIYCELILKFWSRSFTAILTESEPKSRVHWIPSLETEKIMIFCKLNLNWVVVDCRLKWNKMILIMNMSLKSSANRKRIRLFQIWTLFNLLWCGFGFAWLWLAQKILQKWRWSSVVAPRVNKVNRHRQIL